MALVRITHSGNHVNMDRFLKAMQERKHFSKLESLASEGVSVLAANTPVRTGTTAAAWRYEINMDSSGVRIDWINDNNNNGFNVALGLQYGHGTGTGGYVRGVDYINPAIKPIFDRILEDVWREVVNA